MSGINFKLGKIRYWFSDREGADKALEDIQERIRAHRAETARLIKLHADMKKAIEAVS